MVIKAPFVVQAGDINTESVPCVVQAGDINNEIVLATDHGGKPLEDDRQRLEQLVIEAMGKMGVDVSVQELVMSDSRQLHKLLQSLHKQDKQKG